MKKCPFCHPEEIILKNDFAWARYDKFPVTTGHILIITYRHIADFRESTAEERQAIIDLLQQAWDLVNARFKPDGYNLGINCGAAAGQTIMHLHLHLIPRYHGDMENPRGGVRGVIPERQNY
ncbi:MAG: HIT family protein [Syntrophomonadaceae bacterium]|nr:HIT family protein [Syntrophomonadaceae bacterium]